MTYTIAVCTVLDSWWWTKELSETCRVLFQKWNWEISASHWFYYKNISWCTVLWMPKWSIFVLYCNVLRVINPFIPNLEVLLIETIYSVVFKKLLLYNLLDKYWWLGVSYCFHFLHWRWKQFKFPISIFFSWIHNGQQIPWMSNLSKLHVMALYKT